MDLCLLLCLCTRCSLAEVNEFECHGYFFFFVFCFLRLPPRLDCTLADSLLVHDIVYGGTFATHPAVNI
jgi:hypothetical protein